MPTIIRPRTSIAASRCVALVLSLILLLAPGVARAQDPIALEPLEDPTYGLTTVVPTGWTTLGPGIRARRTSATDPVVLAIQSAPIPADQLWDALLSQLRLTERPESTGTRATDALSWVLYQVDVALPSGTLQVDLGTAEDEGTTYLVLLQAPLDAAAVLRDQVFLPVIDALAPLAPEPTPDPATLPYVAEDVSFTGGASDVTLHGTLTMPRIPGPHPGIVLFSGSGPQDRDESLRPVSAIKPFALLADALTRAGIAVLRYDDRGTAASTGDYAAAGLADFTADAAAALAYLRTRPEIDPERVGVLGHSEGGVYTASLIEAGEDLAFAIGMAAPATNGVDLLIAQNRALVRSSGGTPEDARLAGTFARDLYAAILDDDLASAERVVRKYFGALYDRQTPDVQAGLGDRAAFIDGQVTAQLQAAGSAWFKDLLRSDAGVGWKAATMPVLGVFGGKDVQVVAVQNAPLMKRQLKDSDPASRVVILPDANHLFQSAQSGGVAEYGTLDPVFTPDFLPLVVGWVTDVVGLAPTGSPEP